MAPFTLRRRLNIRSKEYNLYEKVDRSHGAIVRIEEMGGPANRQSCSNIFVNLDAAIEMCDRLNRMEQYYQEFRPLPRNCQLCSDTIVESDSTYQLELNIVEYRQLLRITQSKPRVTRKQSDTLTVLDIGDFRRQLLLFVEHLCGIHYRLNVEPEAGTAGIVKVVRGKRVAVVYCTNRPWPWTRSYPPEKLIFDPVLVGMILFNKDVVRMRNYCEATYPDLVVETFVDMNDEQEQSVAAYYQNLNVRWIRRGDQFRINERPGMVSLKREERWFTA